MPTTAETRTALSSEVEKRVAVMDEKYAPFDEHLNERTDTHP